MSQVISEMLATGDLNPNAIEACRLKMKAELEERTAVARAAL